MPTPVYLTNGTLLTTVADQSINTTTTSISLLGIGAVTFSEAMAETLVHLMENFSAATAPRNPLAGQLWYNSSTGVLNVFSGSQWTNVAGSNNGGVTVPGGPGISTIAGNATTANRFAGSVGANITFGSANTTVVFVIAEGKIVSVTAPEIVPVTALPVSITLGGVSYLVQARFPAGFRSGVTLATDANNYVFTGTSSSSSFADVGERYEASEPVEPGDVVEFGGDKEIRKARRFTGPVLGVISTDPAVRLNDLAGDDATHPVVALIGRVPCKVVGPVAKFAALVPSNIPGVAQESSGEEQCMVIGRALEAKTDAGQGVIEVALRR